MYSLYNSNRQMGQTKIAYWGSNQHNLLSPAPLKSCNRPQHFTFPFDIVDISASQKHISFIASDGSLYSYGINIDGRLGVGGKADLKFSIHTPAKVKLNARAVRVKCGFSHVCVQLSNQELYAWGLGDYGSLGIGQFKSKSLPTRVNVKGKITQFSCGAMHSGFVDTEGNIFTCGSNEYGELGVNKPQKVATPMLVNFSHKVKQIECGVFYTLLLTAKGQVYGMGNNKYGQLGIGHKVNECHPTLIRELENIASIAAGYHSGAIDNDGNLYIWGSGSFGQLLKPKKIILPTPVDQIFIRGFFGVAVSSNRERRVYAWGNNTYGQLGRGNFQSAKEPTQVSDLNGVRFEKFACGVNFFMATSKDENLASALAEQKVTHKNRFEYLQYEREDISHKSPYTYAVKPSSTTPKRQEISKRPLNYEAGGSTYRIQEQAREIANRSRNRSNDLYQTYRSPVRAELEIGQVRLRSRSRQQRDTREIIEQEIRRSRSRSRNYEELFVSLSADYQTLLARYKALEDHLQSKNRSMAAQKQELTMIFNEQGDILREENAILKRELAETKQALIVTQSKSSGNVEEFKSFTPTLTSNKQNDYLKEEVVSLSTQLATVKQQLRVTLKKLAQLEDEGRVTPRKIETKKIPYEFQRQMEQLKDLNNKLNKQLKTLKEQFKITIAELENFQLESLNKDSELRQLKQKRSSLQQQYDEATSRVKELETAAKELKLTRDELRSTVKKLQEAEEELAVKSFEYKDFKQKKSAIDYKEEYEIVKKELTDLSKDHKIVKDELKNINRKYSEIQEEIAIRNLELRDVKQKKQTIENQLKQQVEILNEEMSYLTKEFKITKDELKITLKKLDSTEEELAIKSLEVKDLKQRKLIYDATEELKSQILSQRDQILTLTKENKSYKQELRSNLKKIEEIEEELAIKSLEAKDARQKLGNREQELQSIKNESNSLSKDTKELKQSLKSSLKELDHYEEIISSNKSQITSLQKNVRSRQEQIKQLQKRNAQIEDEYKELKFKKESEIQNNMKKLQNFSDELASLKQRQKQLSQNLKQANKTINQRERNINQKDKYINQLSNNQKKVENQLYKSISALEDEKGRLSQLNERGQIQRKQLEDMLKVSEQNIVKLGNQYQLELNEAYGNLVKLKQVQDLNEIRVGELKTIIDGDQKIKSDLATEIDIYQVQIENLQGEKKQLFKMLDEIKAKQADATKVYKDRIIELENEIGTHNERLSQLEVELNYQKDYHSKCQFTIKELTDNRDKACKDNQTIKQDMEKQKEKVKELSYEVEKNKTFKKEIEVLTLQLERVENSTKEYKRQIEEVLLQKEEIIKEQRNDLEKKQREVDILQQKYDNDVGSLNREIKDGEKKLTQKNKQYNDIKKEVERKMGQIDNLKDTLEKIQRKLSFKNEQLEKQLKEHERTTEEFNNLRRQYAKLKSEKEQLENKNEEVEHEKRVLEGKINEKKKEIELVQGQIKRFQSTCDNLRKQTELSKKELQQSNWALEESNRINDQLSRANKEFAQNEQQFTHKISDLEGKIFELEDENKSYTPRYEALLQRNRQLDERNRELSQMINKAIEIQAEAYKTNILKEVEINTGEIIQQIKEEQEFKYKGRRRESISKEKDNSKIQIQNIPASEIHKAPGIMSKIKDEPYTKLMNEKINVHKKKVSDSAQKLAGILDIHGKSDISDIAERHSEGKEFSRSMNIRREEDYQRINNQMDSLNQQKQEFMQKISSFAERLKIL